MGRILSIIITFLILNSQVKLISNDTYSNINFGIGIMNGLTNITGKFNNYEIEIIYHQDDISKTSVEVAIDVSSMNTGIEELDKDFQKESFFHTKKHPYITFISSEIKADSMMNRFIMFGKLNLKGIERNISFPLEIIKIEPNVMGIKIKTKLNRKEFNIGNTWTHKTIPNFFSDYVELDINLITQEAPKKKKKKKKSLLEQGKKILKDEIKKKID